MENVRGGATITGGQLLRSPGYINFIVMMRALKNRFGLRQDGYRARTLPKTVLFEGESFFSILDFGAT